MREPAFWWRKASLASGLLAPAAACYGAIAARRMARQGSRVGVPVLCVGNFTLGGAGKTPLALTLARLSTMGLGAGQGRLLVITEALPPVLAAAVAGAVCALALVPLLGPVLDLSVFTGSGAAAPVRADLAALAIPAAGLVVLGVATLSAQAFLASRRGAASALRISG